jgi:perosamine synthetase
LEEGHAAAAILASGWVAQGPEVEEFENELCEFFDLPSGHAMAVSSGSAGLYLALWALDAQNKYIGLPVYACSALRNAIGLINGRAVYFDCAGEGPNIDVMSACREGIDILIAPSMFGLPVDIPHTGNIKIIEDIAQSFGAISNNKRIGLRGDIGVCSFYATKMMTAGGQGGALISRDKILIDRLKDYREFDCRHDRGLRFNFQMTDLQAAIGRVQLKKMPTFIERRENIFQSYRSEGLNLMDSISTTDCPVRYRAVIRNNNPLALIEYLGKRNISAIISVEQFELLDNPHLYPIATRLTQTTVSLPCYPGLPEGDARNIAEIVKGFL